MSVCGMLLRRLVGFGEWREDRSCHKPATVEGPDGVMRCVQHDRMARGLPGRWKSREIADS